VVGVSAGTFVGFRFANARLRQRIEALRHGQAESGRLRDDNRRAKALLAQIAGDKEAAARAIDTEVGRLRGEVAALEKRAVEGRGIAAAQLVAEDEALATNRDPEKGFVRAEFAGNAGHATPGAAMQTLVWSALKGDDEAMARTVALSGAVREKAEALLARLPEEARPKYPTPEKLAGLFFARMILKELEAFQIAGVTMNDPQHATVRLRFPGQTKEPALPFERSETGWRVTIVEKQIDLIEAQLGGGTMERKAK
ncbi:MAG: hypothetical protein ABIZ49_01635, partial [Opitutaceae bacterium]